MKPGLVSLMRRLMQRSLPLPRVAAAQKRIANGCYRNTRAAMANDSFWPILSKNVIRMASLLEVLRFNTTLGSTTG